MPVEAEAVQIIKRQGEQSLTCMFDEPIMYQG